MDESVVTTINENKKLLNEFKPNCPKKKFTFKSSKKRSKEEDDNSTEERNVKKGRETILPKMMDDKFKELSTKLNPIEVNKKNEIFPKHRTVVTSRNENVTNTTLSNKNSTNITRISPTIPKKKFKFKKLPTSTTNLDYLLNDISPADERTFMNRACVDPVQSQNNSLDEDESLLKILEDKEEPQLVNTSSDAIIDSFSNKNYSIEEDEKLARLLQELEHKNSQVEFDEQETSMLENINWDDYVTDIPSYDQTNRTDNRTEFQKIYPHTAVMTEVLHNKFGLKAFRPNQQEIINAALEQHDCFVLMPTGGGKSLCYQLPAILTPGVTVVISPLRALIADQVDKLNALDIPAAHLCSDISRQDSDSVLMKLNCREPTIKLLYLTPEKIVANVSVQQTLKSLCNRDKLSRFVIDEAHCLSQWGHDFRPDYKQLSSLRREFSKVPIMCLTATATTLIQQDVTSILKLRDVKVFITSFNRPNIKYEVITKPKAAALVSEISRLILSKFHKKSGIIYCFCRKDCDTLAIELCRLGIKARSYHAGMNDVQRETVQRMWMKNECHAIVATIAFGMGIDKPDVRYVIHHSVPKSVEAFYQESGRAGRDGEVSYSYLFYSYADIIRLKKLMRLDRSQNQNSAAGHDENLHHMATYSENKLECRRYLQLIHLGEKFDRKICLENKQTTCDNCLNMNNYVNTDITKACQEIGTLIHDFSQKQNVTMGLIIDLYKGSKSQKIMQGGMNNHPLYGKGATTDKVDLQRFLIELVSQNIVQTFCINSGAGYPLHYIKPGSKYQSLFSNEKKIMIAINKHVPPSNEPKPSTSRDVSVPSNATIDIPNYKLSAIKLKCHEELLDVCKDLALQRSVRLSSIINLQALQTMSEQLPDSKDDMLKIQYVTQANYEKFGEAFLKVTKKYRIEVNNLSQAQPLSKSERDDFVPTTKVRYRRRRTRERRRKREKRS